jgi:hypothetical protein
VSGSYVCVAGLGGVSVISVADPANPAKVGDYITANAASDVCLDGDLAYVAVGTYGFRVVSIQDPTHPLEIGHYKEIGQAYSVASANGYVHLADGSSGLLILQYYESGVEQTSRLRLMSRAGASVVSRSMSSAESHSTPWGDVRSTWGRACTLYATGRGPQRRSSSRASARGSRQHTTGAGEGPPPLGLGGFGLILQRCRMARTMGIGPMCLKLAALGLRLEK